MSAEWPSTRKGRPELTITPLTIICYTTKANGSDFESFLVQVVCMGFISGDNRI